MYELITPNQDKLETLRRDTAPINRGPSTCRVSTKQIQITNIKTNKKPEPKR